jgi:hypothetical protein
LRGVLEDVRERWPTNGIAFATGMNQPLDQGDGDRTALLPKPHGFDDLMKDLNSVVG